MIIPYLTHARRLPSSALFAKPGRAALAIRRGLALGAQALVVVVVDRGVQLQHHRGQCGFAQSNDRYIPVSTATLQHMLVGSNRKVSSSELDQGRSPRTIRHCEVSRTGFAPCDRRRTIGNGAVSIGSASAGRLKYRRASKRGYYGSFRRSHICRLYRRVLVIGISFMPTPADAAKTSSADKAALKAATLACKAEAKDKKIRWPAQEIREHLRRKIYQTHAG